MYTSVPSFLNGNWMRRGAEHHTIATQPFLRRIHTAPKCRSISIGDRFPATWLADQEEDVFVAGERDNVPPTTLRNQFIPAEPAELELSVINWPTVNRRWPMRCSGKYCAQIWSRLPVVAIGATTDHGRTTAGHA